METSEVDQPKRAVVCFSGGIDSVVAAYVAEERGFEILPIYFEYGQENRTPELARVFRLSSEKDWSLDIIDLRSMSNSVWGHSPYTVPNARVDSVEQNALRVNYRNLIFLSIGAAYAAKHGAERVIIGLHANAEFREWCWDDRPEFRDAADAVLKIGDPSQVRAWAPLMDLYKKNVIALGERLGVDWSLTWSCHRQTQSNGQPCGKCAACIERAEVFAELGIKDPLYGTE